MDHTGNDAAGDGATLMADLLGQRLCHDLSGPLGALMGVLELAAQENPGSETVRAAEDTARSLGERLRLLRAAWGGDGVPATVADLQALAAGLPQRRVALDVGTLASQDALEPGFARVLVNAVLLAAEALPGGGRVTLGDPGGGDVVLAIEGARAAWPPGLMAALVDPDAALAALETPRQLQAPLLALVARAAGVRLALLQPAAGRLPLLLISPR